MPATSVAPGVAPTYNCLMRYLALILFLPWFAIIGFTYWHLPRGLPRPRSRWRFDAIALLLAIAVALAGALIAMDTPWRNVGRIWPQVAAVLFAYGAFLAIVVIAAIVRARIWRR